LKAGLPLRSDQESIWRQIKDRSADYRRATGAGGGTSDEVQVIEGPVKWATHPEVLKAMLAAGLVTPGGQRVTAVPAALQILHEDSIFDAIRQSIDSGFGAALLIDRHHWVVAYRYTRTDEFNFTVFIQDPGHTRSALALSEGGLARHLLTGTSGKYTGKCVVVTAGAVVPVSPRAAPPAEGQMGRSDTPQPMAAFPDGLSAELVDRLGKDRYFQVAFAGVERWHLFKVRDLDDPMGSYYLADFRRKEPGREVRRTGRIAVDGRTLKPLVTAGIETPEDNLSEILGPEEITTRLDGRKVTIDDRVVILDRRHFVLEPELVWKPCDQSRSMLEPFYVLGQPGSDRGKEIELFVRVDGKVFPELTQHLTGA
jgi:hypothetical protein